MSEEMRAVVRLTLDNPQTLADLREFMGTSVMLGMPPAASVECTGVPRSSLIVSAFLDTLGTA